MRNTVPTLKVNDIELRPTYQEGHTFIIFDSTFSEEIVDLKMFAKKFVIENGFNQWFIFDIKGFSNENRLWVEVFSK